MSVLGDLRNHTVYSMEQAFRANDVTTQKMRAAISTWFSLYLDHKDNDETDSSQNLPYLIVNKLVKTVFSEYECTVSAKSRKADFMRKVLRSTGKIRKEAMQKALIGGECLIKPNFTDSGFTITTVGRDCFIPFARDASGKLTDVGLSETTTESGIYYTLFERRTLDESGHLTVQYKLFRSNVSTVPGSEIPLQSLPKYEALEPVMTLPQPLSNVGMVSVKTPMFNCIDGSSDGVSVYAPAVKLIQNINRNERQFCDEFENGASRIIASADMVREDASGKKKLSDKLFIGVDENPEDVGITIFSPPLREQSYLARKQEYLRNIESLIGMKRGILSEVEAAERTATEITSSAGDYNLTITDFQEVWEQALRELLSTCDALGQMYRLCDAAPFDPETDLAVDFGDGVLFNRDKACAEYKEMVSMGILKPELFLAWYFDLPHDTPADLQAIRDTYMPLMESLVGDGA